MSSISTTLSFFRNVFDNIEWRIALKTGLAAGLSLFVGLSLSSVLNRPDTLISGLWCVLSSIVVSQTHLGETYKAAWLRFLGIFIGSILGGILTIYLGSDPISLGFGIFFTVIICSILNIKDSFRIACMSVAVVMLFWEFKHSVNPWVFSFYRFIDSCIGIITTLVVAYVVLPEKAVVNLKQNTSKILLNLGKYYMASVDFERERDDETTTELFIEISDLLRENRGFLEISQIEKLHQPAFHDSWTVLVHQLENIFESIDTLQRVNTSTLNKIFDDTLAKQVDLVIDKTSLTFQEVSKSLTSKKKGSNSEELAAPLTNLSQELTRFRSTHTTGKFSLEDVESFFVFFYSLRSIANQLRKIQANVLSLS